MKIHNRAGNVDWDGLTKLNPGEFADELAKCYGCKRVRRADLVRADFAGTAMSSRFLREECIFPFRDRAEALCLAIARPVEDEVVQAAETAMQSSLTIVVATADDVEAALATSLGDIKGDAELAPEMTLADDDLDQLRDLARGAPVVRAFDDLVRSALDQRATDLHIEPFGNKLQVRLRIDGMLKTIPSPPLGMAKGLLSRLKIIAGLDITERRRPQDGRARITIAGSDIDLRMATMPSMHGEGAVIRFLKKNSDVLTFERTGLCERDADLLRKALAAPFGLIVVTGPTGSGKTTTLATSLAVVNSPTRKILTIEDPIEYQIPGINQTQVHPAIGVTFAAALRAFLRQDPDIIMVGEMRDAETARIAVHAALTGHLVLTTLHTNTAAAAIPRLIDLEVESFLLASSLRVIVAQRLVRILCEHCKVPHRLSASAVETDPRYGALGFAAGEILHQSEGCELCDHTGFHGRCGVFEVLEITPRSRRAIGPQSDAMTLQDIARSEGMTTMIDDGAAKCRAGVTTADEVFRVAAGL
jgi:general secretion pathway protein E